ncbi:SH3 domain-containing protein, partial [Sulfitobacter sp.]
PGTNFGVVGKLGKGDAVEVIEDNGAGWVRFRSVDGSESGWMADFLLNNG